MRGQQNQQLIEVGQIKVGVIPKLGLSPDEHNNLAMLIRLDLAIAKARTKDIFTDEINPPHS